MEKKGEVFPVGFAVAQMVKKFLQCRKSEFSPQVGEIPWRSKWQPPPVFWPGESHGQRSLVSYSLWDCKELDTTERLTVTQVTSERTS